MLLICAWKFIWPEEVHVHQGVDISLPVQSPSASPSGHLEVLLARHGAEVYPVELAYGIKADRPDRVVYSHCKGLGGIQDRYQPLLEQVLDHLFEHRQKPCMMITDSPLYHLSHLLDARHVVDVEAVKFLVKGLQNLFSLCWSEEVEAFR